MRFPMKLRSVLESVKGRGYASSGELLMVLVDGDRQGDGYVTPIIC